jgi:hypothetical protein
LIIVEFELFEPIELCLIFAIKLLDDIGNVDLVVD